MTYIVGSETIANKYLAYAASKRTGNTIRFDLFEKAFDKADWSIESSMSWDSLLDIRAQQIASKNKPIILGYSGGSDSYTMYEVLKRNNIKIAAIHIRSKPDDELERLMFIDPLAYMHREAAIYNFKIFQSTPTNKDYELVYSNPDWIWESNPRVQFSNGFSEQLMMENNDAYDWAMDQDYIYVTGHDKPRLLIKDDTFYSYQDDQTWHNLTDPRVHSFFITDELPELHIKQSYMLSKYIKRLAIEQNKPLDFYQEIWNANKFDAYTYSIDGCGRYGDLAHSHIQKKLNRNAKLIIGSGVQYGGRDLKSFNTGLLNNEKFIKNYLGGLFALRFDPLTKDIFNDYNNNMYYIKLINSKLYKLNT